MTLIIGVLGLLVLLMVSVDQMLIARIAMLAVIGCIVVAANRSKHSV